MPVSDFECQIARGQIGRYLGGDTLSPQAMAGLEEHIAECPGCKALVAERRAALMGQIDATPTHAVVSVPAGATANPLVAAIRARNEALAEETPAPKAGPRYAGRRPAKVESKRPGLGKPLALAALLALVLVGMSRLSSSVGDRGARASAAFASETLPAAPVAPKPIEKPQPEAKAISVMPTQPTPAAVPAKPPAHGVVRPVLKPTANPAPRKPEQNLASSNANGSGSALAGPLRKAVAGGRTPKPNLDRVPKPAVVRKAIAPMTVVRRRPLVLRRAPARHLRRAKLRAAVRVYRPDGRPL